MNIYISLIITMVFSAFFSGMEIAFVSVDKLRFEMERKGGVTSRILSVFFKNPNEFISTMLVGNNKRNGKNVQYQIGIDLEQCFRQKLSGYQDD